MYRALKPLAEHLKQFRAILYPRTTNRRRSAQFATVAAFERLEIRNLLSVTFEVVADLNTETIDASSLPGQFVHANGYSYFLANTPTAGRELWRTDGTYDGTWMVQDSVPGSKPGVVQFVTPVGNHVFYKAAAAENGPKYLWRGSDLSPGAEQVRWHADGDFVTDPWNLTAFGDQLYFLSPAFSDGWRIFRLDSNPGAFPEDVTGQQLFTPGVILGEGSFVASDQTAFFTLHDGEHYRLLAIRKDAAEPVLIGRFHYITQLVVRGDRIFFRGRPVVDGSQQPTELKTFMSDGTTAGTASFWMPDTVDLNSLTTLNDGRYLFLSISDGHGRLWHTDGTDADTVFRFQVELLDGERASFVQSATDNRIYFQTLLDAKPFRLWTSDGTLQGTFPFTDEQLLPGDQDVPFEQRGMQRWKAGAIYSARGAGDAAYDFYYFDESTNESRLLAVRQGEGSDSSTKMQVFPGSDTVYFRITSPDVKTELWASDGMNPPALVRDIHRATDSSYPRNLMRTADRLYFSVDRGQGSDQLRTIVHIDETGTDLQITDGMIAQHEYFLVTGAGRGYFLNYSVSAQKWNLHTLDPGGTQWMLLQQFPDTVGMQSSQYQVLGIVGENLVFTAAEPGGNTSVWVSDGTTAGTVPILHSSSPHHFPNAHTVIKGGSKPFMALMWRKPDGNYELWSTDGTSSGTRWNMSTTSPPKFGFQQISAAGDQAVFLLTDANGQHQLWKTDGTSERTTKVKNLYAPWLESTGFVNWYTSSDSNRAFFTVSIPNSRTDLWVTDGTASGTDRIRTIVSPGIDRAMSSATVIDQKFYFATSSHDTFELWVSDGTNVGTQVLLSFQTDSQARSINLFSEFGQLFIQISGGIHPPQLWISDGTLSGTRLLLTSDGSPPPEPKSGFAAELIGLRGELYYSGLTDDYGAELIRLTSDVIQGIPGVLRIHNNDAATVTWREVFGAEGYEVEIRSLEDASSTPELFRVVRASWQVEERYLSGIYQLRVRAVRNDGSVGKWSTEQLQFTLSDRPQLLPIDNVAMAQRPILRWINPDSVLRTDVWISNLDTGTRAVLTTVDGTSMDLTPLQLPPALYAVWVRSHGDGGLSEWSDPGVFTILSPPPQITLAEPAVTGGLSVSWTPVTAADDYEIYVQKAGSGAAYDRLTGVGNVSTAQTTRALPGDQYTVWVRALRSGRPYSRWSPSVSLLIRQAPQPVWNSPQLTWAAVGQAAHYEYILSDQRTGQVLNSGTTAQTQLQPIPSLPPGRYEFVARTIYADSSSSAWDTLQFEEFRPAVSISPVPLPTVDATPVIQWQQQSADSTYEIYVSVNGQSALIYGQRGIRGNTHRIAQPLAPGDYRVWIREFFADGTRSQWGSGVSLSIGRAPIVSTSDRIISWTPVRDATHYEIQIQRWDADAEAYRNFLIDERVTASSMTLPITASGQFRTWVRAIRNESGETYRSFWSVVVVFSIW